MLKISVIDLEENHTKDKIIEMSNFWKKKIERKKKKTLFQVCCYGDCIMCGYAISIWGKIVGGELLIRTLASILLLIGLYLPST